jgi:hypothetical protein
MIIVVDSQPAANVRIELLTRFINRLSRYRLILW